MLVYFNIPLLFWNNLCIDFFFFFYVLKELSHGWSASVLNFSSTILVPVWFIITSLVFYSLVNNYFEAFFSLNFYAEMTYNIVRK